ncbi:MAG: hypothetical protein IJ769_02770, partial [Clostridia bacterium]|nr:hypothetical protein [Clostridia bacterium]
LSLFPIGSGGMVLTNPLNEPVRAQRARTASSGSETMPPKIPSPDTTSLSLRASVPVTEGD